MTRLVSLATLALMAINLLGTQPALADRAALYKGGGGEQIMMRLP